MHTIGQEQDTPIDADVVRALSPLFFYFVSAGIATVMLGPLLPALSAHWHLRDSQAGTLFTADFLGQLCGSWFAARNLKASVVFGAASTAAGCAALAWLEVGPAHLAFFAVGLGLGAGLTAGNILAGTVLPASRTRLVTMLNVAWGAGAIACPLLIRVTVPAGGVPRFLYIAAALLAASALWTMMMPSFAAASPGTAGETQASGGKEPAMPLAAAPLLVFAAAMLLYVGAENALGGWLPSYAVRIHPAMQASSVSLTFWVAELIGRLMVAALLLVMSEGALYRGCLALLLSTEVMLCVISHPSAGSILALTTLTALTLAPVYPLILSLLLARTGKHVRLGVFFAGASCGGALLPFLTGVLSTQFHGLRAGLIVPATAAGLLLALAPIVTARTTTCEPGVG